MRTRNSRSSLGAKHRSNSLDATQFRLLVESVSSEAVFLLDTDGCVASWNPGAERIKGYRAEEIIGCHLSVLYVDEDRKAGKAETALRVAAEIGRYDDEGWRRRKDGSRFWAETTLTALRDSRGRLTGFAKITRDRTHRRFREALMEGQCDLLSAIASGCPLEEFLRQLVMFVERLADGMLCSVMLLDESGGIQTGVAPNVPAAFIEVINDLDPGRAAGLSGTNPCSPEPVIVVDTQTDLRWEPYRDLARRHHFRACWLIPILGEGNRVLGTLGMYDREPRAPTDLYFQIVELATQMAKLAIQRVRDDERLRTSEARLRLIMDNTSDLVALVDTDGRRLYNSASYRVLYGKTEGLTGTSIFDDALSPSRCR